MTTRQRQVFPRDEVAHLWAHQAQVSARDSTGSFFFNGRTIYSYGAHFVMGHILSDECGVTLAGRVLWNDESRSNTTSKHQSIVRQALTRQQQETAIHFPAISEGLARSIERALQQKRLPDECVVLLRYVRENISELAGKKHGSGPFANALRMAKRYQETALLFYARAGKKYPLPIVPDMADIPADKAARDAFILTFARADIERQYRENLTHANAGLIAATDAMKNIDASATFYVHVHQANGARDRARNALASANKALILYSRLHGADKKSRTAQSLINKLSPVFQALEKRAIEAEKAEKRERVERTIKRFTHARGMVRAMGKNAPSHHARNMNEEIYRASTIAIDAAQVGIPAGSWLMGMAGKMARSHAVDSLQREVEFLKNRLRAGDSYFAAEHFADAKREYAGYMRKHEHVVGLDVPARAMAHFAGSAMARHTDIAQRMANIDAAIIEKNKALILDWISGASNVRPAYDAGTFARINTVRGIVETTRGANVPIEHACRLARMYAVTVRRGGQSWPDGSGPMVGHYRVNKIGADGSLVIGCHEFSPVEAKRLHDVLMACDECATVSA